MDDWESRQPCPDGRCTGVLGDDGLCGTCGKGGPGASDEPRAIAAPGAVAATHDDWDARTPCPDGSCTGILGADSVCGTCGKKG